MALTSGTKLGPYEVVSPLGAGGMGEVYRARDTRLDRTVAIKVLPVHLSDKAEAKERFEREAKAISSLNHPNICHLYDVGEQDGVSFLVMEYLEGETLSDRLRKGPLPLELLLRYGTEICEGLEKAHKSGVVHRDLKPGNIMLTKAGAKLMDFGLAKPAKTNRAASSGLTQTIASANDPLTAEGTVVGTFQYMAPEQVEGQEADARSDIFALGAVLYEMTTGQRAFEGKTTASTIAAILAGEPKPISAILPMTPPALERVVKSCLAKDPDERIQTAHDVKLQLKWAAEGAAPSGAAAAAVPAGVKSSRKRVWLVLPGLLLMLLIGAAAGWWAVSHQTPSTMYFNSAVPFAAYDLALSPDGHTVALVAYSDEVNKYAIWTYEVGGRKAVRIAGTEDGEHPFWSPDGRSLAFFAKGKLKRVDAFSGASVQILCDAPHGRGGAWSSTGFVLFTPDTFSGFYKVPAGGGTPTEVTQPDREKMEQSHRWPTFLPDGKHFLYLAANFGGRLDKNQIYEGSLDGNEKKLVMAAGSNVAYADPGYIFFWRDGALIGQKFDVRSSTVSGDARTLSDGVQYFPQTDLALFSVVGNGPLVLQTGKGVDKSQFLWFDRNGKQVGTVGPQGWFANPKISPDERRLAFEQTDRDGRHVDIWVSNMASGAMNRLTFGPGLNEGPIWSPDGRRIAFGSNQSIAWGMSEKNSDGSGLQREVIPATGGRCGIWDWSRDGTYQLVLNNRNLYYRTVADGTVKPLLDPKWVIRNTQFSPDARWIAYSTNETGTWEIFVSPFPGGNGKWQVSRGGGEEPRWRRDGKELFFLSAEGRIMAVPVKLMESNFESGSPVALFQAHLRQPISAMDVVSYDVSADGQRFLVNTKMQESNPAPMSIILNWRSELDK
jgi:Tol biopolymer transport system component/predicted Ser/Thr protein kinase